MNLRLLPLLGVSASALLALKLLALTLGPEGATLPIKGAVAQENSADAPSAQGDVAPAAPPAPPPDPTLIESLEIGGSSAERAVLESLGRRRESLQEHEGQLDLREKLLQATEERIQKRINELKELESSIEKTFDKKKQQEISEVAGLVTMYENMKPKDAARIFDRLSMPVLLKVVRQMKPRKMADILAKMSPDAAEKLTVAIASSDGDLPVEAETVQAKSTDPLPKIPSN